MASGRMDFPARPPLILSWRGEVSKREFENERWILVEIAVAYPFGLYQKIHNAGRLAPGRAVRPGPEIDLLISVQLRSAEFFRNAFILNGLFPSPAEDETSRRAGLLDFHTSAKFLRYQIRSEDLP